MPSQPFLKIEDLTTVFETRAGLVKAVDRVSLELAEGQTLGLVGESGCGKSVTALSIMRLVPHPPGRIESGRILFGSQDLLKLSEEEMRRLRGNDISMIFQEPMTSLNPVLTVGDQIGEVFRLHQGMNRSEALAASVEILQQVGIPSPEKRIREYPHHLSGGMRQRVMIAMALACRPQVMIADEPTTALDVTIQAQILALMNQLKEEIKTTILLITHNLGVVAEMADRVAVMYTGRIVEYAPMDELFEHTAHPYTLGLLHSLPPAAAEAPQDRLETITGIVPSLLDLPSGCKFRDRCPDVFELCAVEEPPLYQLGREHFVRCFRYRHTA
ncbi:MAG: ABC transporter ATP-binding protein [Deltaproteobacteria bacterium]|nr:ABC transporter ATP-binding protein [Deltaproteobacteria bacterium]MBW2085896.1 ABC transporter ATP-binding protein [Deltaproteobacteria bacterium]